MHFSYKNYTFNVLLIVQNNGEIIMNTENKKRYDSSRRANAKYNKEKTSMVGIRITIPERAVYEKSAAIYSIPLSQFMRKCAIYCIRNGIDIKDVDLSIEDLQE